MVLCLISLICGIFEITDVCGDYNGEDGKDNEETSKPKLPSVIWTN